MPGSRSDLAGAGRVQSLERAFQILNFLADHPSGASVAELCDATGLARATVTRFLASLADQGAAVRVNRGRAWGLGPAIVHLARAVAPLTELVDRAHPLLEWVAQRTREAAMLGIPVGPFAGQIVDEVMAPRLLGVASSKGQTLTTPASALVRQMLAELPDDELRARLAQMKVERLTPSTLVDASDLLDAIHRVQEEGVCVIVDEFEEGLAAISVPVRREGILAAMIGIYMPTARLTQATQARAEQALRSAAARLARPVTPHIGTA